MRAVTCHYEKEDIKCAERVLLKIEVMMLFQAIFIGKILISTSINCIRILFFLWIFIY
jgi:hypothetical protein